MQKKHTFSRRNFLKTSFATLATIHIVPRYVLGGAGFTPPSEQPTRAVIGTGGMGMGHVKSINTDAKLLAVCDVDQQHLTNALKQAGDDVKGYKDFREILDRKDIDIVHIPTPPHWHALISIAAAKAGKDIWCEKPMSRTIGEGEKVVAAVNKYKRIFRLNTWFRFEGSFYGMGTQVKPIKKVVENRLLGWPLKVTVNAATGFNWKFNWVGRTNLKTEPVPEHLDYQFWLGPAPYKPYHPHRVHSTFRGYWDYDGGGLGDMGQHYLDPIQYLLEKDNESPIEIEADAPPQHPDACGTWRYIRMKYADGCEIIIDGVNRDKEAAFIEGPEGKIYKSFQSDIPNIVKKMKALPDPEPQVTDFLEAVKTRKKFALNETNGHRSCTLINLAKIAVQTRRPLHFNDKTQRFINDDNANLYIEQAMRWPWRI
ncbi:MAG TPA: Gfo/Idh/MocA family oxidoreductase [Verrucomicrobiales bacterium]|nr:Gfo/Idh/MocA family oxidoreductase [Verrucomicrobiales bacterium]HIL72380.1 Gfo/Idh/MocA family oxidoreductase [Verrucomicrobiota bacterium]